MVVLSVLESSQVLVWLYRFSSFCFFVRLVLECVNESLLSYYAFVRSKLTAERNKSQWHKAMFYFFTCIPQSAFLERKSVNY